jgi:hypothetical protein
MNPNHYQAQANKPGENERGMGYGSAAAFSRLRLALFGIIQIIFVIFSLSSQTLAAQPRSIQADFIQEKDMRILAKPLVSKGRLLFRSPDNLRWEYLAPVKSVLLMKDGNPHKFVTENGAWRQDDSPGLDAVPTILAQMTGWLEGRFSDANGAAMFAVSRQRQVVRLTPKEEGMRAVIAAIELHLVADDLVDEVDIHEGGEAVTRIKFKNTITGQAIPDALFAAP